MKFGEKVRTLRREKGLSQAGLAGQIGVSQRTVAAYETGNAYPRYLRTWEALARALDTQVNYLRTEDEIFMEEVGRRYGSRGQHQAQALLREARELFAGGELSEEDKLAFLTEMQQLFLDAKKRAKKFAPGEKKRDDDAALPE